MPHLTGRGPRLEPDHVVRVSLRLMDEVGLDGLSLRRLAEKLDVKAQALYWHFTNKQELLDTMAHVLTRPWMEGVCAVDRRGSWRGWLEQVAHSYRALLLSHRDGARLVAITRPLPDSIPLMDACVLAFQRATGCGPAEALQCLTAITAFVRGFVLDEQAEHLRVLDELGGEPHGTARDAARDAARHAPGAGPDGAPRFDPEAAPHLAAALTAIGPAGGEKVFAFGLALIIEGIGRTVVPG